MEGRGTLNPGLHRYKLSPCAALQAAALAQRHRWPRALPRGRCARTPAAPAGLPPWRKVGQLGLWGRLWVQGGEKGGGVVGCQGVAHLMCQWHGFVHLGCQW